MTECKKIETVSRETLLQLADRCEAATGADRELDALIKAAVYGGVALQSPFNGEWCVYAPMTDDPRTGKTLQRPHSVPHVIWQNDNFSASIDAAATLVQEGMTWSVDQGPSHWILTGKESPKGRAHVHYVHKDWINPITGELAHMEAYGFAANPPLALTSAALRARAEALPLSTPPATEDQ